MVANCYYLQATVLLTTQTHVAFIDNKIQPNKSLPKMYEMIQ